MNHNNRKFTSFSDLSVTNMSRTLSSPVAESTHLEGSGNNRSGLFASPVKVVGASVKRKPTSPLLNSRTSFKSSGNLSSVGFGRIDSQVYTDAQSRGLVNRLVKYHDRTQSPLNRSQSMTSIYSKPGQFPVVHLKKTEIKYSPRRNNSITSVRIAPPEKSVFQANTRSNILRAGSLLIPAEPHLKQSRGPAPEDEIDAENRVIAPTTELEAAPTRSVLDALKEISRKRINNEELDADRIKKQCKELSEVDSGGGGGTKRARELTSSTSPPLRGSGEQQLQKKRLCCKNNDILSSLSSSLVMSTPKRVEHIQPKPGRLNVDQTFSTPMATAVGLNATVATEGRVESREPVKVSRLESAPLPQIVRSVPEIMPSIRPKPTQPKITLFNKKYDETVVRPVVSDSEEQEDEEELGGRISFIKPKDKSPILNCSKVTLKQVEKSKLSMILSCLSEDFDDEEEEAPKMALKAPIVVKDSVDAVPPKIEEKKVEVVVSKPSGIAALISEPIKDPGLGKIVPPKPAEAVKTSEPSNITGGFSFGTPTKSDNNATFSFQTPTKSTTPVESKPAAKQASGFSFGSTPATVSKADAPPAYSFPSTTTATSAPTLTTSGFAFTSSAPSSIIATPKTTLTTPNLISFSPVPISKSEAPKSGFSLLPAISTNASSGSPQNSFSISQSTIPTFGSGSGFSAFKPLSPTGSSAAVSTSASNHPSFGSVAASTTGVTATTSGGGFAFGASNLRPTITAAAVATTTPSSTTSAFTFGGATSGAPALTASVSTPAFGAPAVAKFGFGSTTTAATSAPSFGSTITTSAAPSFGGGFPASAPPTTAPPPFGSVSSSSTTSVTSPPSSGIFGGGVASKPAFGQPAATNSSFSFGAAASQQPTSTTSAGAFSFGAVAPTATTAAPTTTSNIFGSGGSSNTAASFGAAPSFTNHQVQAFGNANSGNPPAFGASNSGTAPVAPTASGFGATPVFGAASSSPAVPANASSVFGASSTVTSPFGGITSASAPTGNIFGAPSSNNNQSNVTSGSSPFSFGASPAAPTNSAATSLAPTANKSFSFGGIGSTSNNITSTSAANPVNSFAFSAGSNSSAPAPAAPAASAFSFSNTNNNNNNNNSCMAPPPAFGSTGNSSFSFNASNTSSSNTATVKPFSFGTPAQPTTAAPAASGGGLFGAGATSPPPAFNFSAGSNAIAVGNTGSGGPAAFSFAGANPAAAAGGPFGMSNGAGAPMFSIGTGGGANVPPGRRPIRTATRRLK
ncbi:nuclear envelope pore membrane protein POM 121 [Ochlerotatus camptorhynchus]|uniref:nuclear envelope pore membrane protein POM 121 n=1 Tax=Ochlerotatus camptorhynchus TaxID=644619 RepID=UPI0031DFBE44